MPWRENIQKLSFRLFASVLIVTIIAPFLGLAATQAGVEVWLVFSDPQPVASGQMLIAFIFTLAASVLSALIIPGLLRSRLSLPNLIGALAIFTICIVGIYTLLLGPMIILAFREEGHVVLNHNSAVSALVLWLFIFTWLSTEKKTESVAK